MVPPSHVHPGSSTKQTGPLRVPVTQLPMAVHPSAIRNPHRSVEGQSESEVHPVPASGAGGQVRICQPQTPSAFSRQTPVGPAIEPSQQMVFGMPGSGPHWVGVQVGGVVPASLVGGVPASFAGGGPASTIGGGPASVPGHPTGSQLHAPVAD